MTAWSMDPSCKARVDSLCGVISLRGMRTLFAVIAIALCACGGATDDSTEGGTGGGGAGGDGAGGSGEIVTPHIPPPVKPDVGPCGVVPNADYCACALECPDPVVVSHGVVSGSPDCWSKTCGHGVCGIVAMPPGFPCSEGVCNGNGLCVDKLPE
jgi:hypothetical protein